MHVIAERLEDRGALLDDLGDQALAAPPAASDEFRTPQPRTARHPRDERAIPRSRDFR